MPTAPAPAARRPFPKMTKLLSGRGHAGDEAAESGGHEF